MKKLLVTLILALGLFGCNTSEVQPKEYSKSGKSFFNTPEYSKIKRQNYVTPIIQSQELKKTNATITHNIGVFLNTKYGETCPTPSSVGSVLFYRDTEDDYSNNTWTGYTGTLWGDAYPSHGYAIYQFCKLNETESLKFMSIGSTSTLGNLSGYMVLQLGDKCPGNGKQVWRYFEDEQN